MTASWRFNAYDLATEAFLARLNVETWQSIDTLAKSGDRWNAVVQLDADDTGTAIRDATQGGRTVVVAERDGVPVYTGIVWQRQYWSSQRTLQIQGADLMSYFDAQALVINKTYNASDQFAIFRDLAARCQAAAGDADIGVTPDTGNSGVTRDRVYAGWEGAYYGQRMRELSQVEDGFDFDIRVEYQSGVPVRQIRCWYPRRGREIATTGLRFRFGGNGNVTGYRQTEDWSTMASRVWALGAGDGQDRLRRARNISDLTTAGWPYVATAITYPSVSTPAVLIEHGDHDVAERSVINREEFEIDVDPEFPGQPFGSWDLGDDCYVVVEDDELWPANTQTADPGLVRLRRVTGHGWQVRSGQETLTVTLGAKVVP